MVAHSKLDFGPSLVETTGSERAALCIYAIVPHEEALAWRPGSRGVRLLSQGPLAAIVGTGPRAEAQALAVLRHDRVVRRALEACSSVIPFRLGVEVPSEEELRRVLENNAGRLGALLDRLRGRIEMGLMAKQGAAVPPVPPMDLGRIHALAPRTADRRERLKDPRTMAFEGCYLISRQHIEPFWAALEQIRGERPDLRVLGSGPWAPYSFCGAALDGAATDRGER